MEGYLEEVPLDITLSISQNYNLKGIIMPYRLAELTYLGIRESDPPTAEQLETYYGLEQMVSENEVVVVCVELGRVVEGTTNSDFSIRYQAI